jgi:hypothetical protein
MARFHKACDGLQKPSLLASRCSLQAHDGPWRYLRHIATASAICRRELSSVVGMGPPLQTGNAASDEGLAALCGRANNAHHPRYMRIPGCR